MKHLVVQLIRSRTEVLYRACRSTLEVPLTLTLFLTLSLGALAQSNPCSCCTENHRQFDFWMGDWNVYDTLGTEIGHNLIVQMQDSCILQENWSSANMTGTSYNYYNQTDSSWHQVWIDNQGGSLNLKGKFINGSMVMKSELITGNLVPLYYNQISWTLNNDGSVTQLWEIYNDQGNLLNTAFKGIYRLSE